MNLYEAGSLIYVAVAGGIIGGAIVLLSVKIFTNEEPEDHGEEHRPPPPPIMVTEDLHDGNLYEFMHAGDFTSWYRCRNCKTERAVDPEINGGWKVSPCECRRTR